MKKINLGLQVLLLGSILFLTACGGGGGGADPDTNTGGGNPPGGCTSNCTATGDEDSINVLDESNIDGIGDTQEVVPGTSALVKGNKLVSLIDGTSALTSAIYKVSDSNNPFDLAAINSISFCTGTVATHTCENPVTVRDESGNILIDPENLVFSDLGLSLTGKDEFLYSFLKADFISEDNAFYSSSMIGKSITFELCSMSGTDSSGADLVFAGLSGGCQAARLTTTLVEPGSGNSNLSGIVDSSSWGNDINDTTPGVWNCDNTNNCDNYFNLDTEYDLVSGLIDSSGDAYATAISITFEWTGTVDQLYAAITDLAYIDSDGNEVFGTHGNISDYSVDNGVATVQLPASNGGIVPSGAYTVTMRTGSSAILDFTKLKGLAFNNVRLSNSDEELGDITIDMPLQNLNLRTSE